MDEALAGAAAISEQRLNTAHSTQPGFPASWAGGCWLTCLLACRVICSVTSAGLCVSGPTRSFAARFFAHST